MCYELYEVEEIAVECNNCGNWVDLIGFETHEDIEMCSRCCSEELTVITNVDDEFCMICGDEIDKEDGSDVYKDEDTGDLVCEFCVEF